jgi:molybdopterin/thiamine biosynthesis adenylyltransferase
MTPKHIHVIGCGGVASHLLTALIQTAEFAMDCPTIHFWDGDKYEDKNIARQFLAKGREGQSKSEVFAEYYGALYGGTIIAHDQYFFADTYTIEENSLIICVVDNHRGRRECRESARRSSSILVSGANETESGEAWVWLRENEGKNTDPWVRYPDLETDVGIDPLHAQGCQSELAIVDNPQIPAGNMLTAACIVGLIQGTILGTEEYWGYRYNPAEYRFVRNGLFGKTFAQLETTTTL